MEMNRMNELPLHIHDKKNGLDYILHGDYYLPDIGVEPGQPIGKYGRARLRYLQEHRSITSGRLGGRTPIRYLSATDGEGCGCYRSTEGF